MSKSAARNQAEGFLDRLAGRLLEAWGALTGQRSKQAKGKAARWRGRTRNTTGRTKRKMK